MMAVNIEVTIPSDRVTAKPLIGPVPNRNSTKAAIRVVILASAMVEKAFSTIADANITTLIAAFVLFLFGTGPIKGFAVTLSLGIVTSMFTAIMGTRAVINLIYGGKKRVAKLAI